MNDEIAPPGGKPVINPTALGREPAFSNDYDDGLTKREYFAGVAMQSMRPSSGADWAPEAYAQAAETAVKQADALLAALARE